MMGAADCLLLALIGAYTVFSVRHIKKHGCCKDCSKCCSCGRLK